MRLMPPHLPRRMAPTVGMACLLVLALAPVLSPAAPSTETIRQNEQDFDFLWSEIGTTYAYFDQKSTDWDKVKTLHRLRLKEVATREEFIGLL